MFFIFWFDYRSKASDVFRRRVICQYCGEDFNYKYLLTGYGKASSIYGMDGPMARLRSEERAEEDL